MATRALDYLSSSTSSLRLVSKSYDHTPLLMALVAWNRTPDLIRLVKQWLTPSLSKMGLANGIAVEMNLGAATRKRKVRGQCRNDEGWCEQRLKVTACGRYVLSLFHLEHFLRAFIAFVWNGFTDRSSSILSVMLCSFTWYQQLNWFCALFSDPITIVVVVVVVDRKMYQASSSQALLYMTQSV